ncbi:MAG: hypothetical protein PHF76_12555 [Bacteroidales bacterium]|nr:hypothetical protein [Bacteroidales bacterium]
MVRPSKSDKWPERLCDILLKPHGKLTMEYCTVSDLGVPSLIKRPLKGQSCIVILGHRDFNSTIRITPEDYIWTCKFNEQGKLSGVGTVINGESIIGKELTVIVQLIENYK